MHSFKVKFYLRTKPNIKDGFSSVLVRIYLDHHRDSLAYSHVSVPADAWDANKEKVKLNTLEGRLINRRLETLKKQITDIYLLHEKDEDLSIELIKQIYNAQAESKANKGGVCNFFDNYIKENEEVIAVDNRYRFVKVATLFKQYMAHAYKVKDIDFEHIDHKMLQEFEFYLCETCGYSNRRTIKNMMRFLQVMLGAAKELGMMEHNPFNSYRSKTICPLKIDYLTIDDIRRLKKVVLGTNRLDRIRDCFLFSCYTGLSYREAKSLSRDKLTRLNGSTWILLEYKDTPRYIPILPFAASIIRKYSSEQENSQVLPLISQQKTNQYLKEIAEIAGINKSLTYKVAVQSFMRIALSSGVSLYSVTYMLRQSQHKTGAFVHFSPERIEDEMALFAAKMGRYRLSNNEVRENTKE